MRKLFCALTLSVILFSCTQKEEKTAAYIPKILTNKQKFNEFNKETDSAFTIYKYEDKSKDHANSGTGTEELLGVKFRDTVVQIQTNDANPASAIGKFTFAEFINTQKTAILVQIADNSGLTAPSYIIALKNDKIEVSSLYRPSNGKQDKKYTKGRLRIGRQGYLINNDFFVTNVNANVYLIKRQNPEERIQGDFLLNSSDKSTLVFRTPSSFYQVNYPTDEVLEQPYSVPSDPTVDIYQYVQNNFNWEKNKKGIVFLRPNNDNRIVDIREFN